MVKNAGISREQLCENIEAVRSKGSHSRDFVIPRSLMLDEKFIEGYALYLAEGDNGSNGFTIPKKLRLVNSDLNVIKLFMNWLDTYLPNNTYYAAHILPNRLVRNEEDIEQTKRFLGLKSIKVLAWNAKKKSNICYRICLDSAAIIWLFLAIESKVKDGVKGNPKLMKAYIRGLMIGEGTVHHKGNFHYVRIEMKNKKEILFLASLFEKLGFHFTCKERGTRKEMWYIYLGGRENLIKYAEMIGFGVLKKRQRILEQIVDWYAQKKAASTPPVSSGSC